MLVFPEKYNWLSHLRWHLYRKRRLRYTFKGAAYRLQAHMRSVKPGDLAIDAGANVGDVSEYFLASGMRVVAFEPDPVAREVLHRNLGDDPRLTIIPKGVGAHARSETFFQSDISSKGIEATIASSFVQCDYHSDAIGKVDIIDLPQFIADLNEPVSVLKLDIEGFEIEVMEALLDRGLHTRIGLILVELHERMSPELAEGGARLRKAVQGLPNVDLGWH